MTEPTDAEIVALADATRTAEGGANGYILPISFARAVLAKWGAPQPVACEPLTEEQIRAMLNKHPPEDVCGWSYRMGIDDAELHHGIKGGQHGAE